jgi:DNA invertase Pin-like site-specific DNA recombinase
LDDTTTPHGRLMLTILGGLAKFERTLIKARTDVRIKRARATGDRCSRMGGGAAFENKRRTEKNKNLMAKSLK